MSAVHAAAVDKPAADAGWDTRQEIRSVLALSLAFGLVGLDRFIINPLFPVMAKELGLGYQDLGLITAVLALTWGLASIVTGRLTDRIGCKRVLVPAVLTFSALVALTGLATGLASLLALRALMGLAEGAFVPASVVATAEASRPGRVGLNVGLLQVAAPLFGLGLAPVLATQLLGVLPSWHWVFAMVALPGLVMAWWLSRMLRPDVSLPLPARAGATAPAVEQSWRTVLAYPNVVANTAGMVCWLSSMMVLAALMPSYLTDHLGLGLGTMGGVLAGFGLGNVVGLVALPALSDRVGRKPVMLVALLLQMAALAALALTGAQPGLLFALLAVSGLCGAGVLAITIGPLTGQSVPPQLAATATGLVAGAGEIFGGALAPALAGFAAQRFGIAIIPALALGAIVAGFFVVLLATREPQRLPVRVH